MLPQNYKVGAVGDRVPCVAHDLERASITAAL